MGLMHEYIQIWIGIHFEKKIILKNWKSRILYGFVKLQPRAIKIILHFNGMHV